MILYPGFSDFISLDFDPTAESYEDGGAKPLTVYTKEYLRINITSKTKTYSLIREILIQNYLQETTAKNKHVPQYTSDTHKDCPY